MRGSGGCCFHGGGGRTPLLLTVAASMEVCTAVTTLTVAPGCNVSCCRTVVGDTCTGGSTWAALEFVITAIPTAATICAVAFHESGKDLRRNQPTRSWTPTLTVSLTVASASDVFTLMVYDHRSNVITTGAALLGAE